MKRWWSNRRRRNLSILASLYLMFWLFGGCADRLILFPSRQAESAGRAERRMIPFQGGELEAWVNRSPGAAGRDPEAFLIVFAGNAGRAEWHAEGDADAWGARPIELWAINHPGFGGSTGKASLSRLAPAALAAFDHVHQHANGRPVFVEGVSLGTTMALHVAANRPADGLILRTPPPFRSLIMGKFGWWNLWLGAAPVAMGVPAELDAISHAKKAQCPAVFILIETDEIVPHAYQRRVFDAYAGEKRLIESSGGGHNDPLSPSASADLANARELLWRKAVEREK